MLLFFRGESTLAGQDAGEGPATPRERKEADISKHSNVWLDHFVVAIDDLEAGVACFESRTGVRPAIGGKHPLLGTQNALVSLGPHQYLEILAPQPGAKLHPMVESVAETERLTPFLWALATDDLEGTHRVLREAGFSPDEPAPGARVTEAGDTLRWAMFTMDKSSPANAPFFIRWNATTLHPSVSEPAGCGLATFSVASTDAAELERLLDAVGFDAVVRPTSATSSIELHTPNGPVTLGG